jgi:TetR/AcrR family transcriptional repressor of mexJK operon
MPDRRAEDPRITRSRELILEASRKVFLEDGYQAATLERVATEAGIAKRTIYNLFDDKDALFRATILSAIQIAEAFATSLAADVRHAGVGVEHLPEIARRLAEATLLGPALPLRRLLVMESHRFPDLVGEYRNGAPEAVMSALADVLGTLAAAGGLRALEPRLAAEHFAFLVMGADLDRSMFTGVAPSSRRVRSRARAGAEVFIAAYAAPGPAQPAGDSTTHSGRSRSTASSSRSRPISNSASAS